MVHDHAFPSEQPTAGTAFVADQRPGTDGQAVAPIDQALLGGAPQRVGRFEYHYGSDTWTWSDTVAIMHGYQPGQIEPALNWF